MSDDNMSIKDLLVDFETNLKDNIDKFKFDPTRDNNDDLSYILDVELQHVYSPVDVVIEASRGIYHVLKDCLKDDPSLFNQLRDNIKKMLIISKIDKMDDEYVDATEELLKVLYILMASNYNDLPPRYHYMAHDNMDILRYDVSVSSYKLLTIPQSDIDNQQINFNIDYFSNLFVKLIKDNFKSHDVKILETRRIKSHCVLVKWTDDKEEEYILSALINYSVLTHDTISNICHEFDLMNNRSNKDNYEKMCSFLEYILPD